MKRQALSLMHKKNRDLMDKIGTLMKVRLILKQEIKTMESKRASDVTEANEFPNFFSSDMLGQKDISNFDEYFNNPDSLMFIDQSFSIESISSQDIDLILQSEESL